MPITTFDGPFSQIKINTPKHAIKRKTHSLNAQSARYAHLTHNAASLGRLSMRYIVCGPRALYGGLSKVSVRIAGLIAVNNVMGVMSSRSANGQALYKMLDAL